MIGIRDKTAKMKKATIRKPAIGEPAIRKPAIRKPAIRKPAIRKPAIRKATINLVWLILLALLLSSSAMAIGVSPARTNLQFNGSISEDFTLTIINNVGTEMSVMLMANGPLEKYISFEQEVLYFEEGEEKKEVDVYLNIPAGYEAYGDLNTDILVLTLEDGSSGEQMTAKSAVVSQLRALVPYPEKYIETGFYATAENNRTRITLPVENKGQEDIERLYAKIELTDPEGDAVETVLTETIALPSGDKSKVDYVFELGKGHYYAEITFHYDRKKKTAEEDFNVGKPSLYIERVDVYEFFLGDIAQIDIIAYSDWNDGVDYVSAELTIKDSNGNRISHSRTPETSVSAFLAETIESYWDTSEVRKGNYTAEILLHYPDGSDNTTLELEVVPESDSTKGIPTPEVVGEEPDQTGITGAGLGSLPLIILLVLLLIIVLLLNMIWWMVIFKRRKRKRAKKKRRQTEVSSKSGDKSAKSDSSSNENKAQNENKLQNENRGENENKSS